MTRSSYLSLLFGAILLLSLCCTPAVAAHGQHGGHSSHGGSHGGGSHGGGHAHASGGSHHSHASGGSHGGGSRGISHSRSSGGGHSSHRSGASRGSSGHSHSRSSSSEAKSARAPKSSAKAPSSFERSPSRSPSSVTRSQSISSGNDNFRSFGNRTNTSFSTGRGSSALSANSPWHSFGNRENSVGTGRESSAASRDTQWRSFGNRNNSFGATERGSMNSWQGGSARSGNGDSHEMAANREWNTFSRGAANSEMPNRGLSNPDRGFGENSTRAGGSSAMSANRVLANFEHTRFNNSFAGRRSFGNSQFGSDFSRFGNEGFDGRRGFGFGGTSFNPESSFGWDPFSFIPDLLNLALTIGSFGARGFGAFGPIGLGLNLFGSLLSDIDNYGYNDYSYGYSGFAQPQCQVVPVWTPGIFYPYPAETLVCAQ